MAELFQAALGKAPLLPVSVEMFDGTQGDDSLVVSLGNAARPKIWRGFLRHARNHCRRPQVDVQVPADHRLLAAVVAVPPLMLGLFGLVLAGAIALVARYQQRAYEAVAQLHETTEKSLLEKDLMLQEMKHRIKNSIARVLAIARQTAGRANDVDEFSASFAARLQAMAASQDMLTRSRWQKADLSELLRIELAQVFGKELPEGMMRGPAVRARRNDDAGAWPDLP